MSEANPAPAPTGGGTSRWGQRSWLVVLGVAVLVLSLFAFLDSQATRPPTDAGTSCATREATTSEPVTVPEELGTATASSPARTINLGTGRDAATSRTPIKVAPRLPSGSAELNVLVGQFESEGVMIGDGHVRAWTELAPAGSGDLVTLVVCVDPVVDVEGSSRHDVIAPGAYTGVVMVDDPRVEGTAVAYTVNLKFAPPWVVLVVGAVAWAIGAAGGVALSSRLELTGDAPLLPPPTTRALFALATSIGAAGGVLLAQYYSDPSWRGTTQLFAVMFGAVVAASYAAANFAGSVSNTRPTLGG